MAVHGRGGAGAGRWSRGSADQALLDRHRQYVHTRDPRLRAELVEVYAGLVRSLAGRFTHRGETTEDLVQVAFVGLLEALERFDPDRGSPFPSFAVPTIVGTLKRHFRDRRWAVRVPRQLQERYLKVRHAAEVLPQRLGRSPSIVEIAGETDMAEEDVLEAMEAGWTFRPLSIGGPDEPAPRIPATSAASSRDFEAIEERDLVRSLVRRLPERDRYVLSMYFVGNMTQAEIARRLGVSQMRISRLVARSLQKLRAVADPRE